MAFDTNSVVVVCCLFVCLFCLFVSLNGYCVVVSSIGRLLVGWLFVFLIVCLFVVCYQIGINQKTTTEFE
jgi:hypothetical protein